MAFIPYQGYEGKMTSVGCASGETIEKGDALVDNGSGYYAEAAETTAVDIRYVAAETVTPSANGQKVLVWRTAGITFLADTDAAWAQTDIGMPVSLASVSTLDIDDGAAEALFFVEKGVGTVAVSTQVLGHFVQGAINAQL